MAIHPATRDRYRGFEAPGFDFPTGPGYATPPVEVGSPHGAPGAPTGSLQVRIGGGGAGQLQARVAGPHPAPGVRTAQPFAQGARK